MPEPSDYAKKQKALADALVAQGQYIQAYNLMRQALAQDQTVQAYNNYIQRLGDIAQIAE